MDLIERMGETELLKLTDVFDETFYYLEPQLSAEINR